MAIEEQPLHSSELIILQSAGNIKAGQRLTISNREVTKLGFYIEKYGFPTGDVTFTIRKVSDDALINSKVWGDAGDLPTVVTYEEVELVDPSVINEEVRISVEFSGGTSTNRVSCSGELSDVKEDEYLTKYYTSWEDLTDKDLAYKYTYEEPAAGWLGKIAGVTNPASIMGVLAAASVKGVASA